MRFEMAHAVWTVLLFVIFIGIVLWAWSSRRKQRFDAAARSVLEDDKAQKPASGEHHG